MVEYLNDNIKQYVVVLGGANMDICAAPCGKLVQGDSNPGKVTTSAGGVGRNVAENITKLGIETKLITALGKDHYGNLILDHCQAAGINMDHVLQLEDERTSTYVSILDGTGDLSVAVNDMTIMDLLTLTHLEAEKDMLSGAEIIVVDTNLNEEIIEYLATNFKSKSLFVDTVSSAKALRILPCLGSVHTLKMNRAEAAALCDIQSVKNDNLPEVTRWFHDRGVKRVFVTLGAQGVFYSDDQENGILETNKADSLVVNTTGAGDAFVAGLGCAWINDMSLIDTVQFAQSAAMIAVEHRSAINPDMSRSAVEKMKKEQYGK